MSYELTSQAAALHGFGIKEFSDFKVVPVLKAGTAINTSIGAKTYTAKAPSLLSTVVRQPPPPPPPTQLSIAPAKTAPAETPPPAYVDLNLTPLQAPAPPPPTDGGVFVMGPEETDAAGDPIDPMVIAAGAGLIVALGVGIYFATRKGK